MKCSRGIEKKNIRRLRLVGKPLILAGSYPDREECGGGGYNTCLVPVWNRWCDTWEPRSDAWGPSLEPASPGLSPLPPEDDTDEPEPPDQDSSKLTFQLNFLRLKNGFLLFGCVSGSCRSIGCGFMRIRIQYAAFNMQ